MITIAVASAMLAHVCAASAQSALGGNGKIAFARSGEIFVMNANGSGETNLTNDPASDSQPAFSPDGTKIAFVSNRNVDSEIWVMDAAGTNLTQVTNLAGSAAQR